MSPHTYSSVSSLSDSPPAIICVEPPKSLGSVEFDEELTDYTLGMNLGHGSTGTVKLARHNVTGEMFAIKIVPRRQKDASQETRIIHEAGLSLLLHHPHICSIRETIVHPDHYYLVFEYVSGGRMLDYIIEHGRLRERVARSFARQIGSALDYCHRNNVAHRNLSMENILLAHTGAVKIIDFGLANLYDPAARLSTFRGLFWLPAPEILDAQPYTGPEVDVWSFGVVLYTLLCGTNPFATQSASVVHAKIRGGHVEYPTWLSTACKRLLSRMLVGDPALRAPLTEVLVHPWMTHTYPGPPLTHLAYRAPLRADALDVHVVRAMTGFVTGSAAEIQRRLAAVLESDAYVSAAHAWDARGDITPSPFPEPLGTMPKKHFSGFGFNRRKLFSPSAFAPPFAPSLSQPRAGADPTRGFHSLVSIYYLVREKQERERVYPGHLASSQLSLQSAPASAASLPMTDFPLLQNYDGSDERIERIIDMFPEAGDIRSMTFTCSAWSVACQAFHCEDLHLDDLNTIDQDASQWRSKCIYGLSDTILPLFNLKSRFPNETHRRNAAKTLGTGGNFLFKECDLDEKGNLTLRLGETRSRRGGFRHPSLIATLKGILFEDGPNSMKSLYPNSNDEWRNQISIKTIAFACIAIKCILDAEAKETVVELDSNNYYTTYEAFLVILMGIGDDKMLNASHGLWVACCGEGDESGFLGAHAALRLLFISTQTRNITLLDRLVAQFCATTVRAFSPVFIGCGRLPVPASIAFSGPALPTFTEDSRLSRRSSEAELS